MTPLAHLHSVPGPRAPDRQESSRTDRSPISLQRHRARRELAASRSTSDTPPPICSRPGPSPALHLSKGTDQRSNASDAPAPDLSECQDTSVSDRRKRSLLSWRYRVRRRCRGNRKVRRTHHLGMLPGSPQCQADSEILRDCEARRPGQSRRACGCTKSQRPIGLRAAEALGNPLCQRSSKPQPARLGGYHRGHLLGHVSAVHMVHGSEPHGLCLIDPSLQNHP